ncbi:Cro/C1-type helix-turn-helix DNA-binding protein [Kribbella rubisoli]|uniref:Cro/C1-type helix-turn-helix DNA-binding protein n=1 Tax=Kribbella rubisoli TaxID=3075929 RepID=A0A4Q7WMG9_9ACTN|nr:helix-turn-helix transcriptional regulator [Kribbella rubisoli]RZU10459.1 Cro/C1-type helix-turn-helix DNA-binding protein [Kribbella rubisoli]
MAEQRRIGYKWNLRTVMAQRNLWKSTELMPLLKSRGINLSESQVYRLATATPERIPARTLRPCATSSAASPTTCSSRTSSCAQRRPRTRRSGPRTSE